jgi:pentatricopeptide repeat protein
LFGYAAKVHERSGGICQLCGAGRVELAFDLWRQMTVEHLIGEARVDTCAKSRPP